MFSGKRIKISSMILLALCIILSSVYSATAISRGEVVYEIMNALDLPVVQEGSGFADVSSSTPHGDSIQAAKALGILPPLEQFYPSLEATNAEALMFAVRALGLFNEAEALGAVCNFQSSDVPPYLMP